MTDQYIDNGDTVYYHVGVNDTSGSGNDGASALVYVRECGATGGAPSIASGVSATLLSDSSFTLGCYEVAIDTSSGYSANAVYAVFFSITADSQDPTGFLGRFHTTPVKSNPQTGSIVTVTGNVGGSVASVSGSVASVTGNVGGSVASVSGSVASVTGNVGGNVNGSVASVTGNDIPIYPVKSWLVFDYPTGYPLVAGTKYAIVARSGGDAYRYVYWGSNTAHPYPRGSSGRSLNGGVTWELYDSPPNNFDNLFEEWGIPKEF